MYWLILYHIIFFWWAYTKPFTLATSELLSTFFPSWRHNEKTDTYYWYNQPGHPVLSTYYPIHRLFAVLGNFFGLDTSFKILVYTILSHYLFASIGWYLFLSAHFTSLIAVFGAITFTYQTYHLKQQPCIVYTIAWFPWIAICPWAAIGMILLAGYYPLSIYLLPLGLFLNHEPISWLIGFLIGSIQLVPFLKYVRKTVRMTSREDVEPNFWETKFYIGIVPVFLLLTHLQWRYLWISVPIVGSYLLRKKLPRIYQRAWLLSAYVAISMTLMLLEPRTALPLLLLQCFDLWRFREAMITRPFNELQNKPSWAFNTRLTRFLEKNLGDGRVEGLRFPLFTGLINKFRTVGYRGGMRLNLMEKYGNPRARVKYTYTTKECDWEHTEIKYLYLNPNFSCS